MREVARDDVIALGEEIRALDLDIEMPDVDPEAKQHYGLAVERYQRAEQALDGARRPEDLRAGLGAARGGPLGDGGGAGADGGQAGARAARAVLLRPAPRAVGEDVEWAPPGGEPRPVPACAADAVRIRDGEDPETRQVSVNGRDVPYWQAGPAYGPVRGRLLRRRAGARRCSSARCWAAGSGCSAGEEAAADPGDVRRLRGLRRRRRLRRRGDFGGGGFGGGGDC